VSVAQFGTRQVTNFLLEKIIKKSKRRGAQQASMKKSPAAEKRQTEGIEIDL